MTKEPEIIVIGDCGQDIFLVLNPDCAHLGRGQHDLCLSYGAKLPILAKHDTVGGNAANAATAFSRLGFETALYTHVGGDDAGLRIRAEFRRNKIADTYVRIDRHHESNYNTILSLDGDRTILSYHLERNYALPRLADAHWVYLSSMRQGCEAIYDDLLGYLERSGAKLCFQPGTYQLSAGSESVSRLLKRCEIAVCNKEEAALYLKKEPDAHMYELLDGIRKLGPKIAVITDGRDGAYASDGAEYWHLDVIQDAPRVDTTGAGDAFAAGFTAAYAIGMPIAAALRWGQAESSSVIGYYGAQAGLLHRNKLKTLLENYPDLIAKVATINTKHNS